MRLRALAAAAAILLPVVGAGGTALAGGGSGWKKIPVSFTTSGGTFEERIACNSNDQCLDQILGGDDGVWTGDLQGHALFGTTAAGPNADNVVLQAFMIVFTGTVKGCGTGTLTFMGKNRFDFDTLPVSETDMVIVPDFGTGDLVGVTGSIHGHTSDQPNPLDGWVRCKVKSH